VRSSYQKNKQVIFPIAIKLDHEGLVTKMNLYELPKDADCAHIRDAFSETEQNYENILKLLEFEDTPIDLLVQIGTEHILLYDQDHLAELIVNHPQVTSEL
jgi:hypothetical protein